MKPKKYEKSGRPELPVEQRLHTIAKTVRINPKDTRELSLVLQARAAIKKMRKHPEILPRVQFYTEKEIVL